MAASAVRIALGTIVLAQLLLQVGNRDLIWGPNGLLTSKEFVGEAEGRHFNLLAVSSSTQVFEFLYWAIVLITTLYLFGIGTRLVSPLFAVAVTSLYQRNPFTINGGSRLLVLMVIYLAFADLDAHFSLLKRKGASSYTRLGAIVHNACILACMLQICLLYFFSVFYKLQGSEWTDGTAVFYSLQPEEFNANFLTQLVISNATLGWVSTYATILYQSAFPWLIWNRHTKYLMLAGAVMLHSAIAVLMGLFWFSATMLSAEIVFLSDQDCRRIGRYALAARSFPASLRGVQRKSRRVEL